MGSSKTRFIGSAVKQYRKLFKAVPSPQPMPPITAGKSRLCVAGFQISPATSHAHFLASEIAKQHPDQYETWFYWTFSEYYPYIIGKFKHVEFPAELKGHDTSPMVWIESAAAPTGGEGEGEGGKIDIIPIGGDVEMVRWVGANFKDSQEVMACADKGPWKTMLDIDSVSSVLHARNGPKATVPL